MAKLRKSKELMVHIVEQHNDAVPPIHRAVASRLLPFSNAAMVHLDSHPDLLIPVHMPADTTFKPAELYESLSIENWILPLVFARHFEHVVWVKPPWARQIPVSRQRFLVGRCTQSGHIRVTSKENYFLTDGLFRPASELSDPSMLLLQVEEVLPHNWDDLDSSYIADISLSESAAQTGQNPPKSTWIQRVVDAVKDKPYVLDVDLDFFSTANPFRGLLEQEEEEALRRLYRYTTPTEFLDETIAKFTSSREDQLDTLERIFTELECERLKLGDCGRQGADGDWSQIDRLTPVLDRARGQGLEEEKIKDLLLLCKAVLRQNSQSPVESCQSASHPYRSSDGPGLPVQLNSHHSQNAGSSSTSTVSSPQSILDAAPSLEPPKALTSSNVSTSSLPSISVESTVRPHLSESSGASSVSKDSTLHPDSPDQPFVGPTLPAPDSSFTASADNLMFLQLHDYGCTLDDTELPHHLSSPAQVRALMSEVRAMLESLPLPALVTIARSSDDGYCPKDEVDHYERDMLKMLEDIFGALKVTKHYEC